MSAGVAGLPDSEWSSGSTSSGAELERNLWSVAFREWAAGPETSAKLVLSITFLGHVRLALEGGDVLGGNLLGICVFRDLDP